jgi:hypothetical protein
VITLTRDATVIGFRYTPADAINTIISDTNAELQLHLHHPRHGY